MVKGKELERSYPTLRWSDALVRWGGFGGEAEASFSRFFSQRVYSTSLTGTNGRALGAILNYFRSVSFFEGMASIPTISHVRLLLPMLLLLPPLNLFNANSCTTWAVMATLWRVLRVLEFEDETDYNSPLRSLEHMTVDHMEMFECDDSDGSGNSVPDKTNYDTPLRSLEHMTEDETDYDTPLRSLEHMTEDETDYDTPLRSLEHMTEDETDYDTPLRSLEHKIDRLRHAPAELEHMTDRPTTTRPCGAWSI
eukprot:gene20202-26947_t